MKSMAVHTKAQKKNTRNLYVLMFSVRSAGKFLNTQFADQGDLDLTRIGQLIFNAFADIMGDLDHCDIVDNFRLDHNSDFTAGLDGKRLLNALSP